MPQLQHLAFMEQIVPCAKMLSKRKVQAADNPDALAVATAIGLVAFGNQSVLEKQTTDST